MELFSRGPRAGWISSKCYAYAALIVFFFFFEFSCVTTTSEIDASWLYAIRGSNYCLKFFEFSTFIAFSCVDPTDREQSGDGRNKAAAMKVDGVIVLNSTSKSLASLGGSAISSFK